MNKHLYRAAGLVGLLAVAWVASGYLRSNPLALGMTLLIGAFYVMGVLELQRFQKDTAGLNLALAGLSGSPASLDGWLATLPPALRHHVRLRLVGERSALPGPALTPYLAGLLVLLGMLGTFVGMVVTLNGTGLALEQASDVQSMRDSLAAPVRGLGLAFGTSVAGVAASAMLGLMSALCRRGRLLAGQQLDGHIATTLQPCTRAHQQQAQRDAAWQLQQQQAELQQQQAELQAQLQAQQAQTWPLLVDRLQTLMAQLQEQSRHSQATLQEQAQRSHAQLQNHAQTAQAQLLASQQQFQGGAEQAYRALATSVDQTLQRSLQDAARLAAATQDNVLQATMNSITRETAALHGHMASIAQQQLDGLTQRFEQQSTAWVSAVGKQVSEQTAALLSTLADNQVAHQATHQAHQTTQDQTRLAAWMAALSAMAQQLEQNTGRITAQAEAQARSTVAEVARLVQSAAEAPRAAAEVVAQLRNQLSNSLGRDNAMLEERGRIMATLNTVLGAVQHTSTEQTVAIDRLVASTATWLEQAGQRFTQKVDAESARLESVAAQLTGSAVDVASLGEVFAAAVDQFSQSSSHTVAHLQRVEEALAKSSARSDEQLAYYVAQAREVIDLSLLSQKQIVDDLQRLARQPLAQAQPQAVPQPQPITAGSEA